VAVLRLSERVWCLRNVWWRRLPVRLW